MSRRRLIVLLGVAIVAGLAVYFRRDLLDAVRLLAEGDLERLRAYVLSFGVWAPMVSAGLMILQAILAPLPASAITYLNGLVFGTWWGALLSWASALAAAAVCFGLSRGLGRPAIARLVTGQALAWSDAFFARFGPYAVFIGRLIPIVSFDVVSYGAGLTPMSFAGFLAATALGMLPATILYSYLGHLGGSSARALLWTVAALTLVGVLVAILKPTLGARLATGRKPSR